jgi:SPASM domain peptide maturase of grasp-with-spasm system
MSDSKYFLLFSNCILVKGASRSIVCDLQRGTYVIIPNGLYDLLVQFRYSTIAEVMSYCGPENRETVQSYFDLLHEHDLIYYSRLPLHENFPALELDWDYPSVVSNVIIEIADKPAPQDIWQQLSALGCDFVEFRILECKTIRQLEMEFVSPLMLTKIQLIDIYIPYNMEYTTEALLAFLACFPIVSNLIVFSAPEEIYNLSNHNCVGYLYFTQQDLSKHIHCGKIREDYFSINIPHYTESLAHNTCLNRKIAIDAEGNIKNCPSMKESYGNIKDTTLEEAIAKPGFKKFWNMTKDQITKCKDCEFRHICTDCRAYTDNPEDIYSAPLKCGYDPYTCTWEEWSTNPLKLQAIDYYGMRGSILPG